MTRRHYRRSRKDPGLLEIAATSDWKISAGMATTCAFAAAVAIPGLFGGNRFLSSLVGLLSPLAWGMAAVFALISLVRFVKQRDSERTAPNRVVVGQRVEPRGTTPPSLTDLDRELMASVFNGTEPDTIGDSERLTTWSLDMIHRIEWKRFEDVCCEFYREKGIRAETTRLGADGGVDIRLFQDEANPSHCTAIVQCKAWNQATGIKPVRELRGVMAHEKIEKAFFMAPAGFSDEARTFATANRIILIDGKLFLAMVQRLPEATQQRLMQFATAGDWTTPTCPNCGVKMTARESARGSFWGCVGYPKCRGTLPMRAASS